MNEDLAHYAVLAALETHRYTIDYDKIYTCEMMVQLFVQRIKKQRGALFIKRNEMCTDNSIFFLMCKLLPKADTGKLSVISIALMSAKFGNRVVSSSLSSSLVFCE